jgi:DNA-binding response OmpR family regulator
VIISDWAMPHLDGADLCRRIRAAEAIDGPTYFIFITGRDGREEFLRGMAAGADDYMSKPIDLDELEARLGSGARALARYRALAKQDSRPLR